VLTLGGVKVLVSENLLLRQQPPFTERLVGTIRWKFLYRTLFWIGRELEEKLGEFQDYYNDHRVH
jgi:hypothetical protein